MICSLNLFCDSHEFSFLIMSLLYGIFISKSPWQRLTLKLIKHFQAVLLTFNPNCAFSSNECLSLLDRDLAIGYIYSPRTIQSMLSLALIISAYYFLNKLF